ncbi:hypothetical protein [Cerasicoccus maritimus]|uniref:hypothetical protein n=1 Tax=Cerasicoccus maritimus TaxID=490089 RepID=UPI0028528EAD|nr:hypothetical protein [Cerasicoccus maritimus]
MLFTIASLLTALGWLTGCGNVDVDSSSAGNEQLAAANSIYLEPEFTVSDESKGPGERYDHKVHEALTRILSAKGYTVVDSASDASIVLDGSYERGKVMSKRQPTFSDGHASAGNAYYLMLNAAANGQTLWSANSPLAGDSLESVLTVLMASFPESSQ